MAVINPLKINVDGSLEEFGSNDLVPNADKLDNVSGEFFARKDQTSYIASDIRYIFGPSTGSISYLSVGGLSHNVGENRSSVSSVGNNLLLDSSPVGAIFLNYYGGTEGVRFGNGANAVIATMDKFGNLALDGTVDGRNVAVDGTKLDGIEEGATVGDYNMDGGVANSTYLPVQNADGGGA